MLSGLAGLAGSYTEDPYRIDELLGEMEDTFSAVCVIQKNRK